MGLKTILNEFVAMPASGSMNGTTSQRTHVHHNDDACVASPTSALLPL